MNCAAKAFALAILLIPLGPVWAGGRQGTPSFAEYRVPSRSRLAGQIVGIGRLEPQESSKQFNNRSRKAARGQSNFAGHYAIVGWSCGFVCVNLVIVDTRTGTIHHTPFVGIGDGPCPDSYRQGTTPLVDFRPDSRLLILRGAAEDVSPGGTSFHDAPCSTRYYVWRRNRLVLVREDLF